MAIVSVKILENCRWFKFNLDYVEILYFIKDIDYLQNKALESCAIQSCLNNICYVNFI